MLDIHSKRHAIAFGVGHTIVEGEFAQTAFQHRRNELAHGRVLAIEVASHCIFCGGIIFKTDEGEHRVGIGSTALENAHIGALPACAGFIVAESGSGSAIVEGFKVATSGCSRSHTKGHIVDTPSLIVGSRPCRVAETDIVGAVGILREVDVARFHEAAIARGWCHGEGAVELVGHGACEWHLSVEDIHFEFVGRSLIAHLALKREFAVFRLLDVDSGADEPCFVRRLGALKAGDTSIGVFVEGSGVPLFVARRGVDGPFGRNTVFKVFFHRSHAAGGYRESEFIFRTAIIENGVHTHEFAEFALDEDFGVEHFRPAGEVGILAERSALRQGNHHTFAQIAAVGRGCNHEGVVEGGRSSPFNVVGGFHFVHFRRHGTHHDTAHPTRFIFGFGIDSFFHAVGVGD